jgi:hypothetical protein
MSGREGRFDTRKGFEMNNHPDISRAIINDRVKGFRDQAKAARKIAKAKARAR